jgi:hypothetical protein
LLCHDDAAPGFQEQPYGAGGQFMPVRFPKDEKAYM